MNLFGTELAHPWLLLAALLAIPAWWWSRQGSGRVVFSSLLALPDGGQTWRTRLAWLPDAMMATAVIALAIAMAGPRRGDDSSRVRRDGIAIMMAVDVSGSMRALDLAKNQRREVTRLDVVKQVFERFVLGDPQHKGRSDDAVGLVAFARYAETRSPLTLDHGNLATALHQLDFAPDNESATAIGAGLELAVQRLIEFKPKQPKVGKVVILLTDGASNVHEIDEDTAIDDAVKAGVKVYTIGAGTTDPEAPIRIPRPDGGSEMRMIRVELDEVTLKKIATRTGGQYFRATDVGSLAKIYAQIDRLERTDIEQEQFTEYHQYFGWFVLAAMALVTGALALRGSLLRRLP